MKANKTKLSYLFPFLTLPARRGQRSNCEVLRRESNSYTAITGPAGCPAPPRSRGAGRQNGVTMRWQAECKKSNFIFIFNKKISQKWTQLKLFSW